MTKDGKAASYIMEPQYTAPYRTATQEEADRSEQERLEEEAHQAEAVVIEKAKDAERWTASQITESVYYFLDDETGWRLVVTDAALGSRFYVLERTYDGGGSWERVNDDPFDGNIGVAEGLVFFGGDLGGPSSRWSCQWTKWPNFRSQDRSLVSVRLIMIIA